MELLVASAVALLMVAGMVTAFKVIGDQIAVARAQMEISGQLRMGQHVIRGDLANTSAPLRPWLRPSDGHGYFEYFEGPMHDRRTPGSNDSIVGDIDDILMFTARNELEPFRGRSYRYDPVTGAVLLDANNQPILQTITSREAEIILWTRWDDVNGNGQPDPEDQSTIHRRVLLIRPDVVPNVPPTNPPILPLIKFYRDNDISVRQVGNQLNANSLADLTKRENRFAHFPWDRTNDQPLAASFPYQLDSRTVEEVAHPEKWNTVTSSWEEDAEVLGSDVVLSNVLAFDVKAYDPLVQVRVDPNGFSLLPHDNAYDTAGASSTIGLGGYVDLYYRSYVTSGTSHFSGLPNALSKLNNPLFRTYCTWPLHYESDGIDQDGIFGADQGTDGFDSDSANGVDDVGERETSPPYPYPLRGIKISIRLYEPDSQAVRQSSIIQDFIPE